MPRNPQVHQQNLQTPRIRGNIVCPKWVLPVYALYNKWAIITD